MTQLPPLFDTHCHCDDPAWPTEAMVAGLQAAAGWLGAVTAGYGPQRFAASRTLCAAVPRLRRAIGLHPWWLAAHSELEREQGLAALMAELALGDAVALGELGLDKNRRDQMCADDQMRWMRRELTVARDLGLPLVLHVVGWHGHAAETLRQVSANWQGVVHRFSGPPQAVAAYAQLGLCVSLALESRPNPVKQAAAVREADADSLMIETDWPFLDCDYPAAVTHLRALAGQIGQWRGQDPAQIIARSNANAARVFSLPLGDPAWMP